MRPVARPGRIAKTGRADARAARPPAESVPRRLAAPDDGALPFPASWIDRRSLEPRLIGRPAPAAIAEGAVASDAVRATSGRDDPRRRVTPRSVPTTDPDDLCAIGRTRGAFAGTRAVAAPPAARCLPEP